MKRVYNYSAGPSVLPEEVLRQAADEMLVYQQSGMSVMEMSHRSSDFIDIFQECKQRLIRLLSIPEDYEVLFLQGGASLQFAMIPMNLTSRYHRVQLIDTGAWATKAAKEAKLFGEVDVLASSKDKNYSYIPKINQEQINPNSDYLYITNNNTIYGTTYHQLPPTDGLPLVADMSSDILSKPIEVAKYALIFAGAQKNMGPAGVTIVIVRKDLLEKIPAGLPTMLDYRTHSQKDSMFNTPPTYSIYMVGKVLRWLEQKGGVEAMAKANKQKATLLYDFIDSSAFYQGTVNLQDRSMMNIPFVLADKKYEAMFLEQAEESGLVNLKGHRSVGGMRASLYNGMPLAGVEALIDFMKEFERRI